MKKDKPILAEIGLEKFVNCLLYTDMISVFGHKALGEWTLASCRKRTNFPGVFMKPFLHRHRLDPLSGCPARGKKKRII